MAPKKGSVKKTASKEVAIGGDAVDSEATELNELRQTLEDHELRHLKIKSEFESLKQLNEDLSGKHDKEVKELRIDLRIAKRDVEKNVDISRYLREEKKEIKDQLTTAQLTIDELKHTIDAKDQEIERLKEQLNSLQNDFEANRLDQKTIQDSYETRVKHLADETKALREQLNNELHWKRKYEEMCRKCEERTHKVVTNESRLETIERDLKSKINENHRKDEEIEKLKKKNKTLQNQCIEMDKQAELFKTRYVGIGAQKNQLLTEKDCTVSKVHKLNKELEIIGNQLQSVVKEKEGLERTLESERHYFQDLIKTEKQRVNDLVKAFDEERDKNREFEERLSLQGQSIYSCDETIIALESKVSYLKEQLIAIKEEAAKHITTISELSDTKNKLSNAFQESIERSEELEVRIESLHHQLGLKEDDINRERIASEDRIGQHMKLITFLQSKVESLEKQKKPLFSITPTKKFVRDSPRATCPELKDLDRLLAEEKTKNRRLVEELNKLKVDAKHYKNEGVLNTGVFGTVFQLKNSINAETSHKCKPNDVFLKPLSSDHNRRHKRNDNRLQTNADIHHSSGSQRMNHNIPHRFTEITNKIPSNKCVSCAEAIHFGRKAIKCSECNATVHRDCAHKLPNNCGLPVLLMQTMFHSSNDVNENYSDDYYQTQPIDDVINVEPLTPSAPEETFTKYEDNSDSSATTDNNESDSGAVMSNALEAAMDSELKEIEEIYDNKENDSNGFSFTDSMLNDVLNANDVLEYEDKYKY